VNKYVIYLLTLGITACAVNPDTVQKQIIIENKATDYLSLLKRNKSMSITDPEFPITVDNDYWVSTSIEHSENLLPEWALTERRYYVSGDAKSLGELVIWLRKVSGLSVTRSLELVPKGDDLESDSSVNVVTTENSIASTAEESSTDESSEDNNKIKDFIKTPKHRVNLRDANFKDVLDSIAERLGVNWRYGRRTGVNFYFYETKFSKVNKTTEGGSSTLKTTTGSNNSGDVAVSESSLTSEETIEPKFWENTRAVLEALRSPFGRVIVNSATGDVTITDSPQYVRIIERYIDGVNKDLSRSAYVKLTALRVVIEDSKNFGLNLDAVYDKTNNALLSLAAVRNSVAGIASLTGTVQDAGSKFNGSKFFIDALSSQGKVTTLGTKHYVLRNHSVITINKGDVEPFVSSISTTNTDGVGATEGSETEEVFLGFGLTFHTQITNKDRAVFNVLFDQTDSLGEKILNLSSTLTSAVPRITRESFRQEYEMRNGQSQVLLALDNTISNSGSDSPLGGRNCLGGCNLNESNKREYILYLMTTRLQ
jgi:type IVB pilus formation R64 PilN family outer membrane protein